MTSAMSQQPNRGVMVYSVTTGQCYGYEFRQYYRYNRHCSRFECGDGGFVFGSEIREIDVVVFVQCVMYYLRI